MPEFPLRQLEARLQKVVTVTTTEVEDGSDGHEDMKGLFVFRDSDGHKFLWSPRSYSYELHNVSIVQEADGIRFLCPACYAKNGGPKGTHSVHVSFEGRNVPEPAGSRDSSGKPSRWKVESGTTIDDLCLSPSILLDASRPADQGCHWHGWVGYSGIKPGHAG